MKRVILLVAVFALVAVLAVPALMVVTHAPASTDSALTTAYHLDMTKMIQADPEDCPPGTELGGGSCG
ncbi:MAG: hypothetical protein CUN55_10880 [Phototrophicales bacterium]|nr:MAG: hypothetical protein CUN55_10880 [Phototrophicales bacterium]